MWGLSCKVVWKLAWSQFGVEFESWWHWMSTKYIRRHRTDRSQVSGWAVWAEYFEEIIYEQRHAAKTNFDSITEIGNFRLNAKQTQINLLVKFIFGVEQIFSTFHSDLNCWCRGGGRRRVMLLQQWKCFCFWIWLFIMAAEMPM